jgi:hypothetical protein
MKNYRTFAILFAAAVALAFAPHATLGQDINTTQPIVVKQRPTKAVWLKGIVVHADAVSLIVREQGNEMAIHTFTYSDAAHDKMQNIIANGGYQTGDAIKVLWLPGTETAIKFKGRPSPAL